MTLKGNIENLQMTIDVGYNMCKMCNIHEMHRIKV